MTFRRSPYFASRAFSVLSAVALFLVLFIYRGFNIDPGISLSGHSLLSRAALFGLTNGVVIGLLEIAGYKFLDLAKLRVRITWQITELVIGATSIFLLFNYFWEGTEWHLSAYLLLLMEYATVMIFPVLMFWVLYRPYTSNPSVTFFPENGKKRLSVRTRDLLFLKAADNYVEVHYWSGNAMKKELIRNTLKRILEQKEMTDCLRRCHRSFAVNPDNVDGKKEQARELVLIVMGEEIPVSAKYRDSFSD